MTNTAVVNLVDESLKAPRYHQVYALIKGWIFDGSYAPGAKLPPETKLCQLFGVSRITTRKALDMLATEGLVIPVQGKGTFVTKDLAAAPNQGDMDQLIRKTARLAKTSTVKSVEITEIAADAETRADLRLAKGATVTRISFVRWVKGAPIGYRVSYVPSDLGLTFSVAEVKQHQIATLLEDKGVEISGADQLQGACLADMAKAALLGTAIGAPLVRIRLVTFDGTSRPVERSTIYYRADRYEHHVFLSRKSDKADTASMI